MANFYTQFSFEISKITPIEKDWLKKRLEEEDQGGFYTVLPEHKFSTETDGSHCLWFYEEEGGSELDVLAELLQDFLREFRPDQHFAFSWADTCSKPQLDAFGGGAVFITVTEIKWMNTSAWLQEQALVISKLEN